MGKAILHIEDLWAKGWTGAGVHVGHLDTGVDGRHPALRGRVAAFKAFDNSGQPTPQTKPFDSGSHGTHTAGIICGGEIDGQPIGVAPDARLHAGVVMDGGHSITRIVRGLDWIYRSSNVRILCLALGIGGHNPVFTTLIEALRSRSVLTICPIGNGSAGCSHSPANDPNVLAVGAVNPLNRPASFSGNTWHRHKKICLKPEILAPGVRIPSASPDRQTVRHSSGTSQACAVVTGIACLLVQAYPEASVDQLEHALRQSCRPLDPRYADRSRYGVVDPAGALECLRSGPADVPPPEPWVHLPKQYRDPNLFEHCQGLPAQAPADCVMVAAKDGHRGDAERGPAGVIVDRLERELGEEVIRISYLPYARMAIISASVRFVYALLRDERVWILSACQTKSDFLRLPNAAALGLPKTAPPDRCPASAECSVLSGQ